MAEVSFSIPDMWASMGILAKCVAVLLIFLSIYSIGIMIERLLVLGSSKRQSLRFYNLSLDKLNKDSYREIITMSEEKRFRHSSLARIMRDGIIEIDDAMREGSPQESTELIKRVLERRLSLENSIMKRGLNSLATIGATSPFIGLFGTVVGIINSFRGMALTGSGGLGSVSAGIAEALVATALGLFVALPAVWAYNAFTQKIENMAIEFSSYSSMLIDFYEKTRRTVMKKDQ